MRIHIINKNNRFISLHFWGFILLAFMWAAFVMPPQPNDIPTSDNAPQIKKEILQKYVIYDGSERVLDQHTETEFDIHGQIILFTEFEDDAKGNRVIKNKNINKFDSDGRKIGSMKYNTEGDIIWSEDIILDEQGRKTRVNNATYGTLHERTYTLYHYDEFDNITKVKTYNEKDEQTSHFEREYNKDGDLLMTSKWSYVLDESNKLVKKTIDVNFDYNEYGELVRATTETQIGRTKNKDVRLFENNYMVEWLKYENNKLISSFKHQKRDTTNQQQDNYDIPPPIPYQLPVLEYEDSKRDPLENIQHTPVSSVTLKKDDFGKILKKVIRENGQVSIVIYYDYDSQNNLIYTQTIYKRTNWTEEQTMEYDEHNNLTLMQTFENKVLVNEQSIEYEYYEPIKN